MATAQRVERRSAIVAVLLGAGVALGLGVAATAVVFSVVAIPIYVIGDGPGGGLDRDLVRIGLFGVAAPIGALAGLTGGVILARWYLRGAHLPEASRR